MSSSNTGTMRIRPATIDDVATMLLLIRELAEYEREPNAVVATEADLIRDGFGPKPSFYVLLIERIGDGSDVAATAQAAQTVGFALYFFTYSTWRGRECLHLEDLFVRPAFRSRGYGVALMRALAREAMARDCPRFVWQVLDWNEPSIKFYESLGADVQRQWLTVRLEGNALARLASAGS